jgi:hypothetical protein
MARVIVQPGGDAVKCVTSRQGVLLSLGYITQSGLTQSWESQRRAGRDILEISTSISEAEPLSSNARRSDTSTSE